MQSYCTQNVGMKCPTPLYQEMNYIKFSLWTYPTTVLTSESWLVLRTITAGPPLGRESKSLFCNQTYRGQEAKSHQFSFYHHENPTSHSLGTLNHMPYTSLVHEANQINTTDCKSERPWGPTIEELAKTSTLKEAGGEGEGITG